MEDFQVPVKTAQRNRTGLTGYLKRVILIEKCLNPFGIALLLCCSALIGAAIVKFGIIAGALVLAAVIGIPLVYAVIIYPQFGIMVLLIAAWFIMLIVRIGVNFPVGTLMDGLQALLIFGFLLKQKFDPNWKIYRNPVSVIILIWIIFNLLQVANPASESRLAWLYTIRSVAFVMLMYFIFVYHIRSVNFIRLIIKTWLALALFGALYAFKQEHFGYFGFEERELSDPLVQSLLFINGHWRKFSIFSDPVAFSYNMAVAAVLCFGLMTGPVSMRKKIILFLLAGFFLLTMLYSGTRGAYVLVPAAIAFLAILNYNKKVMIASAVGGLFIAFLIVMPSSDPTILRFQSAFKPSQDASFQVRSMNQKRIQPYILSHPVGGGLGATGVWGQRFAPDSYLAQFPPDSGYVRVAVELGWVGLLLFCTFMFLVLKTGIDSFYRIKDPELKSYCLAMVLIVFTLNIANYPQEAFVQFPTNIYFYLVIALINVTLILDKQLQDKNKEGET